MFTTQTCNPPSLSQANSVVSPYASIDQNVQKFISSVEEPLEIEDDSETEEIDEAENAAPDGDRPVNRTYYINCQAVYTNSFNAKGVKVRNSGNHIPRVSYAGGTVVVRPSNDKRPTYTNEGASSSNSSAALTQSSQFLDALLDSTFESPPVNPPIPFQLSSSAQSWPPSDPSIEIPKPSRSNNPFLNQMMVVPQTASDIPLPTLEPGHASMSSRKRDKLPATIETKVMPTNSATSRFTPAISTLPGPESQPFPLNPFLPMHTGLHPSFLLPPNLKSIPGTIQSASPNNITRNPWRDSDLQHHPAESPPTSNSSLDTNSKRLEYHLESALATALTIQASGISSSADILSSRAHNTLKALYALGSVEMPVSEPKTIANDPPARFNNVTKNVTKWLRFSQFSQSPKKKHTPR